MIKVTEGAFQNISDHAAAKRVIVKLYADEQNLYLVIQDDGIGFDVNSVKLRGIQNMKSRIKEISSRLLIESSPTGTTITAIVKKTIKKLSDDKIVKIYDDHQQTYQDFTR